jgi:DNA-binding PadR family transcriptional regulator
MIVSYALLGILGGQPSYGYDLKRSYDVLFGKERALSFGQVYATLARLQRDQKITIESKEQKAGPERKKYTITEVGLNDLKRWLVLPEQAHVTSQSTLFVKVITALLLDNVPYDYLDAQRSKHIAKMRELTEIRRGGDLQQALQADYTMFHLEADLRWIDMVTGRLQTLTKEIRGGR